jgi:hypothetical protein
MIIANVATYPARFGSRRVALDSIAKQVDVLNIVLNEYSEIPTDLIGLDNAKFLLPDVDFKDVGKFIFDGNDDDDVFLCDDDIIYPSDYVSWMMKVAEDTQLSNFVLGLHGVTYSDYYDGRKRSGRCVHVFHHALEANIRVNQLGTGTVYIKGKNIPSMEMMKGSGGFVDIRFARIMFDSCIPQVCIARPENWLKEIQNDETLYLSVTSNLPIIALQEVQIFGGLSKLFI